MPEGKQKLERGTTNEEMKNRATALTNLTTLDQSSDAVTSKLAEKPEKRLPSKQRVVGSNPSRDATKLARATVFTNKFMVHAMSH
jgi:hypothetical protein